MLNFGTLKTLFVTSEDAKKVAGKKLSKTKSDKLGAARGVAGKVISGS
jgi:hypothetical protein